MTIDSNNQQEKQTIHQPISTTQLFPTMQWFSPMSFLFGFHGTLRLGKVHGTSWTNVAPNMAVKLEYFPHIFQLIGSGWMAYLRSRLSQQLNGWDFSSAKEPLFWNVGTLKPLESIHGGKEHTNHHPFWKGTWSEPNLQGIIVQPLIFRGVFLADLSCLTSSQLQFSSAKFQRFYS